MSSAVSSNLSRRDLQRYEREVHSYKSVEEFLASDPQAGIIEIDGPQPIEILYVPAGAPTTVVTFHPEFSKKPTRLPMFYGRKLTSDNEANKIFVSDPGLYSGDDVRIAWHAGTAGLPLQQVLPVILRKLIESANGERTLFWGLSAGGFASLFYSKFFPNSLALAINPQTNLAKFGYENQRSYTRAAFGAETPEQHDAVFRDRICSDLRQHYGGKLENYVLYVQNSIDTHVDNHMEPFLESLKGSNRVRTILSSDWGIGHRHPPAEEIRSIIAKVTDPALDWKSFFSHGGPL
ncbi:hypothetical protein AB0N65_13985 [Paenarthrobacter sp. NPDC089322]|uniref:hypothetical protein n=1 Tax=Paenarthrobacter sp. NPDC089322 TaxID=3155065 RepID=UPI0034471434